MTGQKPLGNANHLSWWCSLTTYIVGSGGDGPSFLVPLGAYSHAARVVDDYLRLPMGSVIDIRSSVFGLTRGKYASNAEPGCQQLADLVQLGVRVGRGRGVRGTRRLSREGPEVQADFTASRSSGSGSSGSFSMMKALTRVTSTILGQHSVTRLTSRLRCRLYSIDRVLFGKPFRSQHTARYHSAWHRYWRRTRKALRPRTSDAHHLPLSADVTRGLRVSCNPKSGDTLYRALICAICRTLFARNVGVGSGIPLPRP